MPSLLNQMIKLILFTSLRSNKTFSILGISRNNTPAKEHDQVPLINSFILLSG